MVATVQPIIAVHVTPRSGRDQVVGAKTADDGTREVQVRVTAPPDGGKANKAVCKLIADQLGIAKTFVGVKRGETSRRKLIEVGAASDAVDAWIASLPEC